MENFNIGDSVIGFYKSKNNKIILTNKSFIDYTDLKSKNVILLDYWWSVDIENLISVKILLTEKKRKFYNGI